MLRNRSPSWPWRAATVMVLMVAIPGAVTAAKADPEATPGPTPVTAIDAMPGLEEGQVSVHFSLAPATPEDTELTLLTRWRSCGTLPADDELIDLIERPRVSVDTATAAAHLVESSEEVHIRVDVGTGPLGEPCASSSLVRIPVALSEPLGERTIVDAADASYEPIINEVDSPETGLIYSCSPYGGGIRYSVAELLGPSLPLPSQQTPPEAGLLRIVRVDGDMVHALGAVRPNGRVPVRSWFWRDGQWSSMPRGFLCELIADSDPNQSTATWRLRGERPTAKSKTVDMWVTERVCNGRPLYGRVTQPTWINVPNGIVLVLYSAQETVLPDGTYIDDPWEYYKGKPGVAGRSGGGYQVIDCPGIAPAPYTVNLFKRLGHRKLYDGSRFPPRPRPEHKKKP